MKRTIISKLVFGLIASLTVVSALSGCGNSGDNNGGAAPAQQPYVCPVGTNCAAQFGPNGTIHYYGPMRITDTNNSKKLSDLILNCQNIWVPIGSLNTCSGQSVNYSTGYVDIHGFANGPNTIYNVTINVGGTTQGYYVTPGAPASGQGAFYLLNNGTGSQLTMQFAPAWKFDIIVNTGRLDQPPATGLQPGYSSGVVAFPGTIVNLNSAAFGTVDLSVYPY